MILEVI